MHYYPHLLRKIKKKNFWGQYTVMMVGHLCVQNGPFSPNKYFLGRIINIFLIYLFTNFIVPNFVFLKRPRVMRMCHFSTQNGSICPNQHISKNLLINLVPIIHAYLHSKNQSQISIY